MLALPKLLDVLSMHALGAAESLLPFNRMQTTAQAV